MSDLVWYTKNYGGGGGLFKFADTVVTRLQVRPGKYVVHGRVVIMNDDTDWQPATARMTSANGTILIDQILFNICGRGDPKQLAYMVVSLQGVLEITNIQGTEIIDIRCATYNGGAFSAKLLAEIGRAS